MTNPSTNTTGRPLRLVKPNPRIHPQLERHIEAIDRGLRSLFGDFAAGRARGPLFIHGPVGVGKTRAALCLADRVVSCSYTPVEALCSLVMRDPDIEYWWTMLAEKELAILDEIGTRTKVSDLEYTTIKRFCDIRELAGNRSVFISNLSPDCLRRLYDDRLASRILQGTWFELTGPDRRLA